MTINEKLIFCNIIWKEWGELRRFCYFQWLHSCEAGFTRTLNSVTGVSSVLSACIFGVWHTCWHTPRSDRSRSECIPMCHCCVPPLSSLLFSHSFDHSFHFLYLHSTWHKDGQDSGFYSLAVRFLNYNLSPLATEWHCMRCLREIQNSSATHCVRDAIFAHS